MPTCKITVLKRMSNPDLAEAYRRTDGVKPVVLKLERIDETR